MLDDPVLLIQMPGLHHWNDMSDLAGEIVQF